MGNRHDGANTILGYCLQHRLVKTLRAPDRGIRRARFVVLREAPCPAALVECGFLSNAAEAGRIASPHYRVAMADGFVEGILDLYRLWDLAASVTP
jgi:N-acetylmuramoyl-L-alanine amidase